jgi:hypothetical protein
MGKNKEKKGGVIPTVGFDPTTSGLKGNNHPQDVPQSCEESQRVEDGVLRRTSSVLRGYNMVCGCV